MKSLQEAGFQQGSMDRLGVFLPLDNLYSLQHLPCAYCMLELPLWLSGKESSCHFRRCRFNPCIGKIPWRRTWQPTPVFFLGNPMDRGVWWSTAPGVAKESDMTWQLNKQQPYACCVSDTFFISFNSHCIPQQNKCYYRLWSFAQGHTEPKSQLSKKNL